MGIFIGVAILAFIIFFVYTCTAAFTKGAISAFSTTTATKTGEAKISPSTEATSLLTLGQVIEYNGRRVGVLDYKFTDSWEDKNWGIQKPPEGAKFIWIYVKAENIGGDLLCLPLPGYFIVKYKDRMLGGGTDFGSFIANEPTYEYDPSGDLSRSWKRRLVNI